MAKKARRVEAPYPHFRHYKKSGHPALIVGEQKREGEKDEYKFRKVMHSEKDAVVGKMKRFILIPIHKIKNQCG